MGPGLNCHHCEPPQVYIYIHAYLFIRRAPLATLCMARTMQRHAVGNVAKIALATEAEMPILFGCQTGTVARNHATGNKRNPGACKHALQTVMWTDALVACAFSSKPAIPRLGGAGLTTPESLALVENFVPSGGRGHASRLE